jgi:hypothetical protein
MIRFGHITVIEAHQIWEHLKDACTIGRIVGDRIFREPKNSKVREFREISNFLEIIDLVSAEEKLGEILTRSEGFEGMKAVAR